MDMVAESAARSTLELQFGGVDLFLKVDIPYSVIVLTKNITQIVCMGVNFSTTRFRIGA